MDTLIFNKLDKLEAPCAAGGWKNSVKLVELFQLGKNLILYKLPHFYEKLVQVFK